MQKFKLSLSSLIISLCMLTTRIFKIKMVFKKNSTSSHIFCLFALENVVFKFFLQLNSLLLVCITWTQSNTNIAKGPTIYKTLIFALDISHYSRIYKKKLYKYFMLLTSW